MFYWGGRFARAPASRRRSSLHKAGSIPHQRLSSVEGFASSLPLLNLIGLKWPWACHVFVCCTILGVIISREEEYKYAATSSRAEAWGISNRCRRVLRSVCACYLRVYPQTRAL